MGWQAARVRRSGDGRVRRGVMGSPSRASPLRGNPVPQKPAWEVRAGQCAWVGAPGAPALPRVVNGCEGLSCAAGGADVLDGAGGAGAGAEGAGDVHGGLAPG